MILIHRRIEKLLIKGKNTKQIALILGLSYSQARYQIRLLSECKPIYKHYKLRLKHFEDGMEWLFSRDE
jgi:hypothetical protein